jgi:hypothetical protein
MLELRLNIAESKIIHFYENNVFIFNSALFKKLQINCYFHCKVQQLTACHEDKQYRTKQSSVLLF